MSHASPDRTASEPRLQAARTPFAQAVLVCGKCARKLGNGGGVKGVKSRLKAVLKHRRWGKVRVVETRCLDLCPKRRQVLASARTLAERRLLVVDPGFDAEVALVQLLGPGVTAELTRPTRAEIEPWNTSPEG